MSNFVLGSYGLRALDATGDPIAGAMLETFEGGTSTPITTYSDRGLTSANANPVLSDGDGWFGFVYGAADTAHKFVLKDAAGVTLQTWDDVYTVDQSNTGAAGRLSKLAQTPLEYGAIGDGLADESAAVQSAIDAAVTAGTFVVDLLGLTFRCDSQITLSSNVTLKNGKLDFQACTDTSYVLVAGARAGGNVSINATANYRDDTITLSSAAGFLTDDFILIQDLTTFWVNSDTKGEIGLIQDNASAPVIDLRAPLLDDYSTSGIAGRAIPIENVRLLDLDIIASEVATGSPDVIRCEFTRRLVIKGCTIDGVDANAVALRTCLETTISGCEFRNGTSFGTGVVVEHSSLYTTIDNCRLHDLNVGIQVTGGTDSALCAGPSRYTTIKNSQFEKTSLDVSAADHAQHVEVLNCVSNNDGVSASAGNLALACVDVRVEGCKLTEIGLRPVVPVETNRGFKVEVLNNTVKRTAGPATPIINYQPNTNTAGSGEMESVRIDGNTITDSAGRIDIDPGGSLNYPTHNRITVNGNVSDGYIAVDVLNSAATVARLDIERNSVERIEADCNAAVAVLNINDNQVAPTSTSNGIDVANGSIVRIRGNVCDSSTQTSGINVDGSWDECEVVDNNVPDFGSGAGIFLTQGATTHRFKVAHNTIVNQSGAGEGISLDFDNGNSGCESGIISGNSIDSVSGSVGILIVADGTTASNGIIIMGNTVHSVAGAGGRCMDVSGVVDSMTVNGNFFSRTDDAGANIEFDSTNSLAISGNVFVNGTFGILATSLGVKHTVDGNIFTDMATASASGVTNLSDNI